LVAQPDGRLQLVDLETGKEVESFHTEPLTHIALSPDRGYLAIGNARGVARVWDLNAKRPVTPSLQHGAPIEKLVFSPRLPDVDPQGGQYLGTAARDGTARIWDARNGQAISPWLRQSGPIHDIAFSANTRHLISASSDGTAATWTLPEPEDRSVEELSLLATVLSSRTLNSNGQLEPVEPATIVAAWKKLKDSTQAPRPLSDKAWHERQLEIAERNQNSFAIQFHLDRLIALDPNNEELGRRRKSAEQQ